MAGSSTPLCLYCKSYEGDVRRAVLLKQSIDRFNRDGLKFYVSMPARDRALFASHLGSHDVELIDDEDIVRANPRVDPQRYAAWEGRLSQQVIKSEFWRLIPCESYVCLDSDCRFLRDFHTGDFLHPDGQPYTVMHENKEFQQLAIDRGEQKWIRGFAVRSQKMKERFGRLGRDYQFGPAPFIWARRVWEDLDTRFLARDGLTLWEAITELPSEMTWYGESLLKFSSIALRPIGPLFRCYGYEWYWQLMQAAGETDKKLVQNFLGVVYQSNWYFELDAGEKIRPPLSRFLRRAKRLMGSFRKLR
jgi:Family of unknown function (DUF6492)